MDLPANKNNAGRNRVLAMVNYKHASVKRSAPIATAEALDTIAVTIAAPKSWFEPIQRQISTQGN
ncbi:MAG: hypothetical protein JJ911_09245 [Rhizobiaceae bacterium]|nr:hypothetical protein [Rhizobiaceae bacterium]